MNQPKDWKNLERHPLGAGYGNLSPQMFSEMVRGIKSCGIVDRKVTLHEDKVLDGWQLLQACIEADEKPAFQGLPEGLTAEQFVSLKNDVRRHETEAIALQNIQARRERAEAARLRGESYREIAEREGVDEKTIRKDVKVIKKDAPIEDVSALDQAKIIGRNNKQYDATKPKPRCDRCTRHYKDPHQNKEGCEQCEELRSKATTKNRPGKAAQTHLPQEEPQTTKHCPHCKGTGRVAITVKGFQRPTVEEVRAYCEERKNRIDPEQFTDHYESNGWRVGKTAMKDWRAAVRTWEKNDMNGKGKLGKPGQPNAERENAILMGWYKPSSGEPFDPKKHCEAPK